MMQIRTEREFGRLPLRAPQHEQVIQGVTVFNETRVDVALFIEGNRRMGVQIRYDGAPIVLEALEHVRSSTAPRGFGSFVDGRMTVEVRVGRHPAGGAAIYFHKIAADGPAGKPSAVFGAGLDALDAALGWLMT